MYDVTGRASSSHAPSCPREQKGDTGGWIATKACSRAETCVQEANFLCKKERKKNLANSLTAVYYTCRRTGGKHG